MDVDGRRRLGAQAGGLTSGFAMHLVVSYCVQTQVSCLAGNRPRYVSLVVFSPAAERSCDVLQPVGQRVVSCKRRFSLPVHAASVVKDLFLYVYSSFFSRDDAVYCIVEFLPFYTAHFAIYIYRHNYSQFLVPSCTPFYTLLLSHLQTYLSKNHLSFVKDMSFIADLQFNIKTILYRDRPIL